MIAVLLAALSGGCRPPNCAAPPSPRVPPRPLLAPPRALLMGRVLTSDVTGAYAILAWMLFAGVCASCACPVCAVCPVSVSSAHRRWFPASFCSGSAASVDGPCASQPAPCAVRPSLAPPLGLSFLSAPKGGTVRSAVTVGSWRPLVRCFALCPSASASGCCCACLTVVASSPYGDGCVGRPLLSCQLEAPSWSLGPSLPPPVPSRSASCDCVGFALPSVPVRFSGGPPPQSAAPPSLPLLPVRCSPHPDGASFAAAPTCDVCPTGLAVMLARGRASAARAIGAVARRVGGDVALR